MKLKNVLIVVSVGVQGETRLKPNYLRLRSVSREETNLSLF